MTDNDVQLALGQLVIDYYFVSARRDADEAQLQMQARMLDAVRCNLLRGVTSQTEAEAWLDAGRATLARARSLRVDTNLADIIDPLLRG